MYQSSFVISSRVLRTFLGIREVCNAERALGIDWKKTSAGHYSTVPCPREAKGKARRRCGADSRWHAPEFSDCVTSDYLKIYEKVTQSGRIKGLFCFNLFAETNINMSG